MQGICGLVTGSQAWLVENENKYFEKKIILRKYNDFIVIWRQIILNW